MNDLLYWIFAGIVSLFVGFAFYKILVNPQGEEKSLGFIIYQGWNHTICFFVGVGGILYYFLKVRGEQIKGGSTLSLIDIFLVVLLLMSCMGLMPYFLTNITKGIEAILRKILEK